MLTTTRAALLGLLAERPMSGYDLATWVEGTIGQFWPIARSQVYLELGQLEESGLVAAEHVRQLRLPDKRLIRITDAGRAELQEWLEHPGYQQPHPKQGLLVKLFFGAHLGPDRLADLLAEYRGDTERRMASLQRSVDHLAGRPDKAFARATALHGLYRTRAALAWVDEVAAPLVERLTERAARTTSSGGEGSTS